ncbi:MAG TPA: hypothetical protein VGR91_15645 [Stellaceae bacterium]|nr:hypothetical protein [Stellaceae bacterium]
MITMRPRFAVGLAIAALGAGCNTLPHDASLAGRCATIMQEAFPGADLKIGKEDAAALSITDVRATVTAERTDLPKGARMARDLAVSCRFHNSILVGFRWTRGPEN